GALKEQLLQASLQYGSSGSSALADLKELGADGTLTEMALNESVPPLVRADAALALHELSQTDISWKAFGEILGGLPHDARQWSGVISLLSRTNDVELFVDLAVKGVVDGPRWGQLLDVLKDDTRSQTLGSLAAKERLPENQRLAVQLRLVKDSAQAM